MGRYLPADETIWWYSRPGTLFYKVRGDSEESINEILASVDEEIGSWRQMIDEFGAVVYNR
jgi:hypothetical protein